MTQENKSYRIRNYEDQLASVWQIGSGEFFAVKFDEDDEPLIYTKEQVANAFTKVMWEIAPDEPVKEELKSFKYYHVTEGPEKVNTWNSNGITTCWDGNQWDWWDADLAEGFIKDGTWVVLPSQPEVSLPDTITPEEIVAYNRMVQNFSIPFKQQADIIQRIKSATQNYDMTISVDGGTYHIYDNLCDLSYKADTDEKLIEILDAIDFLSGCVDG